jgi:hypothetical protein
MRVVLACAATCLSALAWLGSPLTTDSPPAAASPVAAGEQLAAAEPASAAARRPTRIAIHGSGGSKVYDGLGAVLGGGGNARYLMDYPPRQRSQILDYLFKPDYGAALQLLKLEIGGDANSTDGAEPSIEHTRGHVRCRAGYEFAIARQAVRRNPKIKLYGLQWAGPGWIRSGTAEEFTPGDITYLLKWLGCARQHGLRISYLGGWNENDSGGHAGWFHRLRTALNAHGYRHVAIVAGDSGPANWDYVGDPDVAILGTHNVCGVPTGIGGPATTCTSPWTKHKRRYPSRQPMWASELGAIDGRSRRGCVNPCASAIDRATVRGFVTARLTGFLEWPVLDAMPPGLPFENRGLVTADQPWSGQYRVNAITWAFAQFTQFVFPPTHANPGGWRYLLRSGSGFLQGKRADGSYVSLVRSGGTAWSTIIEATTAKASQRAEFHVTGGRHLAGRTVHVWASSFNRRGSPSRQFVRLRNIRPSRSGRFTITIKPGWVYSLTTTHGQHKGTAAGRAGKPFPLPYTSSLARSGRAGRADDEPPYLAAQDGAFELARCAVRNGRRTTCTRQMAAARPVFWHDTSAAANAHYPYAVIGTKRMANYKISVDVLLTGPHSSAGLIGRFSCRRSIPDIAQYDGYVFDVSSSGSWRLTRNADRHPTAVNGCASPKKPRLVSTLASGTLSSRLAPRTWHRLSLRMAGHVITASVDGHVVATVRNSSWKSGPAGIEAGASSGNWPHVQYSKLKIQRA